MPLKKLTFTHYTPRLGGVGSVCACPSGQKLHDALNCDPLEKALFVATENWISVISLGSEPIDRVLTTIPEERKRVYGALSIKWVFSQS